MPVGAGGNKPFFWSPVEMSIRIVDGYPVQAIWSDS
jgi:hypothetical protein